MIDPVVNNLRNAWYQKRNHVRIPKKAESKAFLDAFYTAPSSGSPPAVLTDPEITGSIVLGNVLTCSDGAWDGSPAPTLEYQWTRGAIDIAGETANTYTTVTADPGTLIACRVTATNSSGSASATAAAVGPIQSPPARVVNPVVTGGLVVGDTLACSTGTWSGYPPPTFTYQWRRNTSNIAGATENTYVTTADDIGSTIACRVTATNVVQVVNYTTVSVGPIVAA